MDGRWFSEEVTGNMPRITMTGSHEVMVEQHQGLASYRPEELVFRSASGEIRITGCELRIARYAAAEALITGSIGTIAIGKCGGRNAHETMADRI